MRHTAAVLAAITTLVLVPASVQAQQQDARITEPPSQTAVTEGERVTVRGENCPPSSEVELDVSREPVGSTTAGADGAFASEVTIPDFPSPAPGTPEAQEGTIGATCGERRAGVVVVIEQGELAHTGLRLAPAWALTLLLAGAFLLGATHRGGEATR